jgi:hypothetical protein
MRTLDQLRIVHLQTQHPVQPHRQVPCHGHFRQRTTLPLGPSLLGATHLRLLPHRTLRCFHQQAAQKPTALFAAVPESLLVSTAAGILAGNQPQVAGHLFTAAKTFRRPPGQRARQRRDRSHTRIGLNCAV